MKQGFKDQCLNFIYIYFIYLLLLIYLEIFNPKIVLLHTVPVFCFFFRQFFIIHVSLEKILSLVSKIPLSSLSSNIRIEYYSQHYTI